MSKTGMIQPVTDLQISRVRLDSLHEDPANVRRHGAKNMFAIKASLQEFGQIEPLVVQRYSGKVIGGNGRLAAMRDLGWKECDVVEIDASETAATRIGIALNRTGELAEWDTESLATILDTLRDADELSGTGFDSDDLKKLLGDRSSLGEDLGEVGPMEFRVVIEGLTEDSQADLLSRLEEEGYKCRALMS